MSIDNPRGKAVQGVKGLLVWGARSIAVSTAPRFLYPGYEALTASASDVIHLRAPKTGQLRNFHIKQNIISSVSIDVTYTIIVNGSATVISITISADEPNGSNILSFILLLPCFKNNLIVSPFIYFMEFHYSPLFSLTS